MKHKKRKKFSKKQCQEAHARRRFEERFDFQLTKKVKREWLKKIWAGDCEHVETQSNRVSLKRIKHEDSEYTIVYDKLRKTIVTVLPD